MRELVFDLREDEIDSMWPDFVLETAIRQYGNKASLRRVFSLAGARAEPALFENENKFKKVKN